MGFRFITNLELKYGVYISQLIRYFRVCGSYHVFLYWGLLLTRQILNQEFVVVKPKSSLRGFYGDHHYLVNRYGVSVSQKSVCRNRNPILSSFMPYHPVCNNSNTTAATCDAGISYPSGAPEFTPGFSGVYVAWSFVCCVMFCRSLFGLLSFFFSLLYCLPLRCMASNDLFVIFKLFLKWQ